MEVITIRVYPWRRISDVLYFGDYHLAPSTTLMRGIAFAATVLLAPVAVWLAVSHD